jgi:uncharacterized protein YjbI with pentapeptide repeats
MKSKFSALFVSISLVAGSTLIGVIPAKADEPCTIVGRNSQVQGCDFSGRDMFNAALDYSDFSETNLSNVRARYSYWVEVNFTNANLSSAIFYLAYMANSNFTGANLTGVNFGLVNLDNVDFTGANLTGVSSGGVWGVPATLPDKWKLIGGYLIGPGADLRNANLSGLDLTGADLTGATLTGVKSGGIIGKPVLPTGYQLVGGYIFGPGANLANAKLDNIDIWWADFTNVDLRGASVDNASFIYSTYEGVKSGGITGKFQQISNAALIDGFLIGEKVNLEGANLQGADLRGTSLKQANLRSADFTGANLNGVNLESATLLNTDFTDANLSQATIAGSAIRFCRFNGADLTDALVADSTIDSSEFYGANFEDTYFRGTELINTRSAGITGVPMVSTIFALDDGVIKNYFSQVFNPQVTGQAKTGATLELTQLENLPSKSTLNYQWMRGSDPIPGATKSNYVLLASDALQEISVKVTVSKPGYWDSIEYSPKAVVALSTMSTTKPSILGKIKLGSKLTVKVSPWVPAAKIEYQWLRNGKSIKGATKKEYRLVAKDKNAKVSVKVTQSLAGFEKATASSAAKKVK